MSYRIRIRREQNLQFDEWLCGIVWYWVVEPTVEGLSPRRAMDMGWTRTKWGARRKARKGVERLLNDIKERDA